MEQRFLFSKKANYLFKKVVQFRLFAKFPKENISFYRYVSHLSKREIHYSIPSDSTVIPAICILLILNMHPRTVRKLLFLKYNSFFIVVFVVHSNPYRLFYDSFLNSFLLRNTSNRQFFLFRIIISACSVLAKF